ncbi:MAG: acetate kinase [Nitrospirales bacterium]|nr:MAG: acetate kinase [Nitrospirales bacterium]
MSLSQANTGVLTSQCLLQGTFQGIGNGSSLEIAESEKILLQSKRDIDNHRQAFTWIFDSLSNLKQSGEMISDINTVEAVGHRIVHGGERFSDSTLIDEKVLQEIEQLNDLAPLHNPACVEGIHGTRSFLSDSIPMVAVFDTTFHHTLPVYAATYAIPHELAERHHIRRYGFHGIAHASLAKSYAYHTGTDLNEHRLITMQLGNGCSMTAIAFGKSVETSMGFTPSEGLMMGTRSGDLDPSIISYLAKMEQVSVMGVRGWLNENSGLLGVSGRTHDMRRLLQAANHEQDTRAKLAIDMFCYRIRKYLGAYLAVLGGTDAIVFGGGIGEAAPQIRTQICEGMEWCGLRLNEERNQLAVGLTPGSAAEISSDDADIAAYVIGTDEESWIASETGRCLMNNQHTKRATA